MSGPTLLAISSLFSRLLGVIRDNRFAAHFGIGINSDAYFAAFPIIDSIYGLIIFGAISAAFVPIFSTYLAKKDYKNAWEFTNNLLNFLLIIITGVCILVFIFASFLLNTIYPGYSSEVINQAVILVRIMILSPLFFGIAGIAGGIQNAFHTFLSYSLAPLLYNLSIIGGIIWLSPIYGINGVAYGVVCGSFLYMMIQIPVIYKKGFHYQWILNFKRPDFRKTMLMAIPRIFGLAIVQINIIVEGFIASSLTLGSLTVLRYAQNLQSFPIGIVGLSLAISSFGVLSKQIAKKEYQAFQKSIISNIRKIIFLGLPASIGLFVLRHDIVQAILSYGKFAGAPAELTTHILGILCLSLIFLSITPLLGRAFYAFHDTKTPVIIGVISIVTNLILGKIFSSYWGLTGLASASIIAATLNFCLLYYFLNKRCITKFNLKLKINWIFLGQVGLSSIIMGGVVFFIHNFGLKPLTIPEYFQNINILPKSILNGSYSLLKLLISTGIGGIIYLLLTNNIIENKLLRQKYLFSS